MRTPSSWRSVISSNVCALERCGNWTFIRERGCSLEATLAGDAVEVYLKIMQSHLCTSLLTHIPPTALVMLALPILHSYLLSV